MKFYRISAIFNRYFFFSSCEVMRLIDILYWPVFDIILWGFTSIWMRQAASATSTPLILLTGLVFWQVVMRSHMEISLSLLEELWSLNLINLFATPLKISEWIVAVMLLSFVKSLFALLFGAFIVWLMYGLMIFTTGALLIPFFFLLLVSGWSLGFLGTSILITAGQRSQSLVWIICWLFAPFSGVFYPVSILPLWAQKISFALPTTYLFEGVRSYISIGVMPTEYWYWAGGLASLYAAGAIALFVGLFKRSKTAGLARLQID